MTSLARTATPRQKMVMRMVRGAVLNAAHAHPDWDATRLARSIAKRAAGTLTAQWRDVLASPERAPSDRASRQAYHGSRLRDWSVSDGCGAAQRTRRAALRSLRNTVGALAGGARRAGQTERYAALVEVLRLIAALR
jgi:hypothetical protein